MPFYYTLNNVLKLLYVDQREGNFKKKLRIRSAMRFRKREAGRCYLIYNTTFVIRDAINISGGIVNFLEVCQKFKECRKRCPYLPNKVETSKITYRCFKVGER